MPICTHIPPAATPLRLPPILQLPYVYAFWGYDIARTAAAAQLHRIGLHRLERAI